MFSTLVLNIEYDNVIALKDFKLQIIIIIINHNIFWWNTWSNRQIQPWSTKQSRSKANRVFSREHTGRSKHPPPTTQEKTLHIDITRRSTLKSGLIRADYILYSQRWRSSIQSAKTSPGVDCGSDHGLLIAKFRLKLKRVGQILRLFMYDLIKSLTIIQWKWQIDLRD